MQWEFQVGPSVGISAADELWVARYILEVTHDCTHDQLMFFLSDLKKNQCLMC